MKKLLKSLNAETGSAIQLKLHEIAEYLVNIENKETVSSSLLSGNAGISLFLFYYARYIKNNHFTKNAMRFLHLSVDKIDVNLNSAFCGGVSGVCWSIHHLIANKFIDEENTDIFKMFDAYLSCDALNKASVNYYDFLHGAIGNAIYLLKRIENERVKDCEKQIIDTLNISKIGINDTCYWEYILGNKINISLSHGLAGTCIFLAKAYLSNINKAESRDLLEKSITFILNQENTSDEKISMFPTFYRDDSKPEIYNNSRLGWCYGDLGIGLALWHSGSALNDEKMKQKAIDIFLFNSKRRNLGKNMVIDASICHGTAGIALIFYRMYINTKIELFYETAIYWLEQTLLMAKYQDGIVGYKANGKELSVDLLNGITGIGLVLLSFLSPIELSWDECLLLS